MVAPQPLSLIVMHIKNIIFFGGKKMEKSCFTCRFSGFRKCFRGPNGEMLKDIDVPQEEDIDEYNSCSGWYDRQKAIKEGLATA